MSAQCEWDEGRECVPHGVRPPHAQGSLLDRVGSLDFRVIFDVNSTQEIFSQDMSLFIHEGSWDDAVANLNDPNKVTEYRIGYPFVSAATISRTEQESIDGDVTATYSLSIISSQLNKAPDGGRDYIDVSVPPSPLPAPHNSALTPPPTPHPRHPPQMSVRIPSTVVTKTTEVDPLSPLTIMGSIAGMWGLVGGFFGFLFGPVPALEEVRGVHRRPLWVRGKTKGLDEHNYDMELQRFQRKQTMRAQSIKVHAGDGGMTSVHSQKG